MHREPPRAAPSSRENRGHRRLTAPLLPVSRLITACHICTITHTHIWACRQMYSSTQPCTLGDLFISQRAICANQNVESSSERFVIISQCGRCRLSIRLCVNYGMKYVLKLESGNMHGCECFSHSCVCVPSRPLDHGVRR